MIYITKKEIRNQQQTNKLRPKSSW